MKKLLYYAAALATMFFTACQQENLEPAEKGSTVSFSVEVPALAVTKADVVDNGSNINDLVYAVYKVSDEATTLEEAVDAWSTAERIYQVNQTTTDFTGGRTKVDVELLNDQNYVVLFWAQVNDAWVAAGNDFDLTNITYPNNMSSSNSDLAAFSGATFVAGDDVEKNINREVILTRPFAQINIGTTLPKAFTVSFVDSKVTVRKAGKSFNVASQTVTGNKEVVFAESALPSNYLTVQGDATKYTYVAMNYVFANGVVEVEYDINTNYGKVNKIIPAVPVEKNFRTNIIGNLLTSNATYEIKLDETWGTPANEVYVWNGSEIEVPSQNTEGHYEIERPSELAWLAAAVNGTLQTKSTEPAESFAGKTFKLTEDIDLNGFEWTPIGSGSNIFKGTFDGQNHTVKNLKISGYNSTVGLFGSTHDGEIKNLVVENAEVSGRLNVGVVAGNPYTSKYTNITVTGLVKVEGMAYVGGVGGKNAYADWTNITVNAAQGSYVKANSVENGTAYRTYVGGVVGFNGEGGHTFKNITSNINVQGSTIDVGGLFGIAHYGNKFENCSCSGNVEIYAAEEAAEAEEIGGIAGVWHNESGQQVTFTGCEFNGELSVNVEGADLSDNTIVGNSYNSTGTGKLIIDGKETYIVGEIPAEVDLGEGNTVIFLAKTSDHNVLVKGNGTLVLNGTTIAAAEGAALEFAEGSVVTLNVKDNASLTGAMQGILVNDGASLLVKGSGSLTTVGTAGSGIAGSVTIDGLNNIIAKGNGNHAFGIGGNGATVIIKNSTVEYACGGHVQPLFVNDTKYGKSEPEGGAAIGGDVVEIENSIVTKVDGGSKAAAIGAAYHQSTKVSIKNSIILEANGGNASAGIGGSRYSGDITADNKQVCEIRIENSTVTATGGQAGAGIGSGYDTHCQANDSNAVNEIVIVNSTVNATGGKYSAGIGTGFHAAALTGSIDEVSTINATSGENVYKDTYSTAQNIGYGVVDPEREYKGTKVTFTVGGNVIEAPIQLPVAMVGTTEYKSIDEAIANWGHNTTLTLIANVTLNDVITLKSTEYHVLDLGIYTMTAAKGKDAISITAEGRSSASYALDIKADATNPGGITATSKAVVKTTGKSGVKDRPIIRFYNGVFDASNVISHSGSNGTNCPQFQFHNGVYNANLSANRALIQIYGGTFNGRFFISVDSSAYALISGGKFKYLDNLYGSALNSDKFTIGSSKQNFDRGVYVDDEGYIVVGGPVITEFGDMFAAKATNASKAGSYLPYSSAAEHGLYYTNAAAAIAKHGEANVVLK